MPVLARDRPRLPLVEAFLTDIGFAARQLARRPGFATTAVLVLGAGIGVNNMMFTLLYSATLRGLPITRPDRVLYVSSFDDRTPDRPLSFPDFEDLHAAAGLSGLAAYLTQPVAVSDPGRAPERVEATYITAGALALVGTSPLAGRGFVADDDAAGAAAVAILGGGLWRLRYGSDPSVIGRSVLIDGRHVTVIGIMPEPSRFPSSAEMWLPLAAAGLDRTRRDARVLRVIGRMRDGVAVSDARAEIESIVARAASQHPESGRGARARVVPIHDRFFGPATQPTWLAFGAASLLIVLVSSANAANLMLSHAAGRTREMGIRGSLGASRGRVVSQLLTESLVLEGLALLVGLAVSRGAVSWFQTTVPANAMPYWFEFSMDGRVFGALAAVTGFTLLVFGLVPALRTSRVDVTTVLHQGGRSMTSGVGTRRLVAGFMTVQFALSVVLLSQVVVSYSTRGGAATDRLIEESAAVSASFTLTPTRYATRDAKAAFLDRVLERVRAESGVMHASAATVLPMGGATSQRLEVEGWQPRDQAPMVPTIAVASEYFATLGIPVVQGREFTGADGSPGLEHAIVNRRFVETYFPGYDPIGKRIRLTSQEPGHQTSWLAVVGLAEDIRQRPAVADPEPLVYVPLRADPPATAFLLVRSPLDPAAAIALLRRAAFAIDPGLPLYRTMSLRQFARDAQWNGRVSHQLILMLTTLALGLALVGLYAITSQSVVERTREIGLRMAVGAQPGDVRHLILRRATACVAAGLVAGIAGAIAWDAVFFSGRPDLRLAAWPVLLPVAAVLTAMTAVACWLPVRRATRLDPAVALRQD